MTKDFQAVSDCCCGGEKCRGSKYWQEDGFLREIHGIRELVFMCDHEAYLSEQDI